MKKQECGGGDCEEGNEGNGETPGEGNLAGYTAEDGDDEGGTEWTR